MSTSAQVRLVIDMLDELLLIYFPLKVRWPFIILSIDTSQVHNLFRLTRLYHILLFQVEQIEFQFKKQKFFQSDQIQTVETTWQAIESEWRSRKSDIPQVKHLINVLRFFFLPRSFWTIMNGHVFVDDEGLGGFGSRRIIHLYDEEKSMAKRRSSRRPHISSAKLFIISRLPLSFMLCANEELVRTWLESIHLWCWLASQTFCLCYASRLRLFSFGDSGGVVYQNRKETTIGDLSGSWKKKKKTSSTRWGHRSLRSRPEEA